MIVMAGSLPRQLCPLLTAGRESNAHNKLNEATELGSVRRGTNQITFDAGRSGLAPKIRPDLGIVHQFRVWGSKKRGRGDGV